MISLSSGRQDPQLVPHCSRRPSAATSAMCSRRTASAMRSRPTWKQLQTIWPLRRHRQRWTTGQQGATIGIGQGLAPREQSEQPAPLRLCVCRPDIETLRQRARGIRKPRAEQAATRIGIFDRALARQRVDQAPCQQDAVAGWFRPGELIEPTAGDCALAPVDEAGRTERTPRQQEAAPAHGERRDGDRRVLQLRLARPGIGIGIDQHARPLPARRTGHSNASRGTPRPRACSVVDADLRDRRPLGAADLRKAAIASDRWQRRRAGASSITGAGACAISRGTAPVRVMVCHWSRSRPVLSTIG